MSKWSVTPFATLEEACTVAIKFGMNPTEIRMQDNPKGLTWINYFTVDSGTMYAQQMDCLTAAPISEVLKQDRAVKPQRKRRKASRKSKRAKRYPPGSQRYDPRNNLRASRWTVNPKFHSFREVERHFRDDFRPGEFNTHLILIAVAKDGTSYEFRQDEETDPWTIEERVLYKPLYKELSEVQQQIGPAMSYKELLEKDENEDKRIASTAESD